MADFDGILIPTPSWPSVPQLSAVAKARGGPGGVMNAQAQVLTDRTEYLYEALRHVRDIASLRQLEPIFDGQRLDVIGYYSDTPLRGGGTFIYRAGSSAPEDYGNVIVTPGGKRWERWKPVVLGFIDAENFGCIAPREISVQLQRAIDTRLNVQLPGGQFTSTAKFNRYKGQIISGTGIPERSLTNYLSVTVITFLNDTMAFDNVPNIALGGGLKNMILLGPDASTQIGVKDGIEGTQGGSSQPLSCLHENLIIKKFSTDYQLSGWAWETTLRRVHCDSAKNYGLRITDAANIVHLENCSGTLGASYASGARAGLSIEGGQCIKLTAFRSENNRNGVQIGGGATVHFDVLYFEGNRDNDLIVNDPGTTVVGEFALFQHMNEGQNTVSCVNVKATADSTTSVSIRASKVIVSSGLAGSSNTLSYFYVGEAAAVTRFTDIDWHGDGALWAAFSGRYAPTEISFKQVPGCRIIGDRFGFGSRVIMDAWPSPTPPTSASFNLTDYDGAIKNLLTAGSRVISNVFSNGVDYWVWDGTSAFVASNR